MSASTKRLLTFAGFLIIAGAAVLTPGIIAAKVAFQPPEPAAGSADNTKLIKSGPEKIAVRWYPPVSARSPVILYSHGNAEDLGMITPKLEMFRKAGFGVLAYDYRGYGRSGGVPTPSGVLCDAEAVWQYLTLDLNIAPERVIVMGFSIGSAPSCHLAAEYSPRAVVLLAPIASAFQTVVPFMEKWPGNFFFNARLARSFTSPLLVIHGSRDIISNRMNGKLIAENGNGKFVGVDGAGHNDLLEVMGRENFFKELAGVARLELLPLTDRYVLIAE